MAKRSRRDSYGNHDMRDEEYINYDSYRPRSPRSKHQYSNVYTRPSHPTTKTWVNPQFKAKQSPPSRDYPANPYNDSGNFREDSRSLPSDDRSLQSRSPRYRSPPSPPSLSTPPSRRPSDQPSHHSTANSKPSLPPSKLSFSIPPSGKAKEKENTEYENRSLVGGSPGFSIRGRSGLQPKEADALDGINNLDADSATMRPKDALPNQQNGDHALNTKPTEDSPPQLELMVKHLSQFAHTLSTNASLTNEKEAVEAKLAKIEQERVRWRTYHSSFASLSEDQEKEIRDYKAALTRIKSKQHKHYESQEKAIRLMATTLLAAQSTDPLPQLGGRCPVDTLSKRLESLEAELSVTINTIRGAAESNSWETKSKLAEIEKAHQTIEADLQNLKSAHNESQMSNHQQLEDKAGLQDLQLSKLDVSSAITKGFSDAGIEIKALRGLLEEIPKLESAQDSMSQKLQGIEEDFKGHKLQKLTYDDLVKKLEVLSGDFHRLNIEVVGDDAENPSLLKILEDFEQNLNAVREEIQQVHQNIATVQDDMDEMNKKTQYIGSFEGSVPSRPKDEQSGNTFSALSQRLNGLEKTLEENFTTLRTEAELKDEMVAEEVEGINKRVAIISDHGQHLRTAFEKLQSTIGLEHTKPVADVHVANGVSVNLTNSISHSHEQHTSTYISAPTHSTMTDTLKEHGSVLESHHNFLADLQSKFNNLTSDELASKMVVQMQRLYPFASSVQNDIASFKLSLHNLQMGYNQVRGVVFNLDSQATQRARWDMETRNVVESVRNDIVALQTTITTITETAAAQALKLESHDTRLGIQEADVSKFSQAFENVKLEATQQLGALSESIVALEQKLASVESDARKETAKMHSKVSLMWEKRPKEDAKIMSPIGTSPKTGSPKNSPSAPPSPRRVLHMRKKDLGDERVEENDVPGVAVDEAPSKKRARLED